MSYEIVKDWPIEKSEIGEQHVQLVKLSNKHAVVLFEEETVMLTDHFRVETGWMDASELYEGYNRIEITRLIASCPEGHDHGLYYQSPALLDLWQIMFNIGEVNAMPESN